MAAEAVKGVRELQSLAPVTKGPQYRPCAAALPGQHIFQPGRVLLIEPPFNEAMLLECFQTCRKRVRSASNQRFAKVLEPA